MNWSYYNHSVEPYYFKSLRYSHKCGEHFDVILKAAGIFWILTMISGIDYDMILLQKHTDKISATDIEVAQSWADQELKLFFQRITDQI